MFVSCLFCFHSKTLDHLIYHPGFRKTTQIINQRFYNDCFRKIPLSPFDTSVCPMRIQKCRVHVYFALGTGVLKEIWCSCRKGLIYLYTNYQDLLYNLSPGGGVGLPGMQNPILACVFLVDLFFILVCFCCCLYSFLLLFWTVMFRKKSKSKVATRSPLAYTSFSQLS